MVTPTLIQGKSFFDFPRVEGLEKPRYLPRFGGNLKKGGFKAFPRIREWLKKFAIMGSSDRCPTKPCVIVVDGDVGL